MSGKRVLSTRKRRFVEALLAGCSKEEAAGAAGVSVRQGRRYLADPVVIRALREGQDVALGEVGRRLSLEAGEMLDLLKKLAQDPTVAAGVRARCALGWLGVMFQAREQLDLSHRLGELEKLMEVQE